MQEMAQTLQLPTECLMITIFHIRQATEAFPEVSERGVYVSTAGSGCKERVGVVVGGGDAIANGGRPLKGVISRGGWVRK